MNHIEQQQPEPHELPRMYNILKRGVNQVQYMVLDSIEHNPNYIGLFAHVIYGGQEMCFLLSYNQLRRHDSKWVKSQLRRMADGELEKRGKKTNLRLRQCIRSYKRQKATGK